jgi:hypothetical protein
MENKDTAVQTVQPQLSPVIAGPKGLQIADLDSLWRFSGYVASSGLAPKGIQSREAIFVAIQMGMEVGLTPMAALQNIAVINGRPSIWGDAQLGVVRSTGELEQFAEWYEDKGQKIPRNPTTFTDTLTAVCRVKRRGYEAAESSFAVSDAKSANLWGKDGPWKQYPARMLRMRARSFALRDQFGDALRGMHTAEEVADQGSYVDVETERVESEKVQEAKLQEPQGDDHEMGPVDTLASRLTAESLTLDELKAWGKKTGNIANAEAITEWADIPPSVATRLNRAIAGLLAQLKAANGGVE